MPCAHDISERETAVADGKCPLCMANELAKLREELYVPGVHVCPKCKFRLVSNTLYLGSGTIGADRSPKECLNGCGNMWRVSERDERKEAQKTAGDLFVENKKLSEENARLKKEREAAKQVL